MVLQTFNDGDKVPSAWFNEVVADLAAAESDIDDLEAKDLEWINVKESPYNAVGDGVADDTAAIQSALDAAGAVDGVDGKTVYLPPATYRCASSLFIRRPLSLIGGSRSEHRQATTLLFDDGVHGLIIQGPNESADGGTGENSRIDGVHVKAAGKTVSGADGIRVRASAVLIHVGVEGFSRDGISIFGSTASPVTNSDHWAVLYCQSLLNGRDGLHIDGNDANAGISIRLNTRVNGGWGIYENSGLGNTHIQGHAAGNTTGPYTVPSGAASNRSLFLGCYSESGGNPSLIAAQTAMVLGGLHGAGFDTFANGQVGLVIADWNEAHGSLRWKNRAGAKTLEMELGLAGSLDGFFGFRASDDNNPLFGWHMTYDTIRTGWYSLQHARNVAQTALALSGEQAAEGEGFLWLPNTHFIGPTALMRRRTVASAAPTSGTWTQGDIVWDSAPVAGGKVGWVCVASGTPGTWKPWGAIDA